MTNRLPTLRHQLSYVPLRTELAFEGTVIANATSFAYTNSAGRFLITNWHVVTGRHPHSGAALDTQHAAIPDQIRVHLPYRKVESAGSSMWWKLWGFRLYEDADNRTPNWLEHPVHGRSVDVIALPLQIEQEHLTIVDANDASLHLRDILLYPSLSVFVLGYPLGLTGGFNLPIWKRGTIANEPEFPLSQENPLPKFYIDTATRKGMSGAPVYAVQRGGWSTETDPNTIQLAGEGRRLVGVYASRENAGNEFEAQLGEVWKTKVIEEIIAGGRKGQSSFP